MKPVNDASTAVRAGGPRATPRAGQIIGERYRLEELLERGAMGSVWRAEQIRLRAPVAVKFLDPSLIGDPEMHERFMQEARSAAAVRSVHVVQIIDYGSDGSVPYIAMELLEGENLDARLSSRGTLAPSELNKIFGEVARGIGQAHAMGVVHRDVKPGNIFIAREGEHEVTKLIDFGIAKVRADALKFTRKVGTQLGTLLGTPQYMSPEQVRGSSSVDFRTDVWALAIIACECLTGRYPFPGTSLGDLTVQICTEKPLAPSTLGYVPAGFDQWFFKGTSKKPTRRFASVEEMAAELEKILLASGDRPPLPPWSERLRGLASQIQVPRAWALTLNRMILGRRFGSRTALLASLLLLAVCAVALSSMAWREARLAPEPERVPSQAIQAASPPPAEPTRPVADVAVPTDVTVLPLLPLALDGLDSSDTPGAPQAAERAAAAPARPAKRERPRLAENKPRPLGAMSQAMGEAGARILQGDGKLRKAPTRAALPTRAAPKPGVPAAKGD